MTGRAAVLVTIGWIAVGCRSRPLDQGGGSGTFRLDAGGDSAVAEAGGNSDLGTSRPLPLGVPCAAPGECSSGFCQNGVCCNIPCSGPCRSCATAGTIGTCALVPAGMLGRPGDCPVERTETCGRDGTCDGAGACRLWGDGTTCVLGQCEGDAVVGAEVCDGRGNCRTGPTQICAPYRCVAGAGWCRTDCATDDDCSGTTCDPTGRCHVNGTATCSSNSQCASGFCAQGVCCASVCAAPCWSCNVPNRVGTCSIVPGCTLDAGAG